MTAQISDSVRLENQKWEIAALQGGELFEPSNFGLEPVDSSTACWRGFGCEYKVAARRLTLQHLEIGVAPEAEPLLVALNGHLPRKSKGFGGACGDWRYRDIALPIPFSGGLILCRDFIDELYVHMGFHAAWKFERVRELIFRDGELIEKHDRSAEIALVRARFLEQSAARQDSFSLRDGLPLADWIEKCFSLDYEKSGLD